MIEKFPFIDKISPGNREILERSMEIVAVEGKNTLIHRGDTVSGVVLVERGALRVYSISGRGKESTLYWIEPGESCILAMNCVFSNILYPAWVDNDKPASRIAIIPGDIYKKLHASEKAVQEFTLDVLSSRIFDLMSTIEEISTLPVDQRLANLLLKKSNPSMVIEMNQDQMASHLGTAREVVTRNLKKLEGMGLLAVERGSTRILNLDGLRDFLLGNDSD